jgi:hypothetical protein
MVFSSCSLSPRPFYAARGWEGESNEEAHGLPHCGFQPSASLPLRPGTGLNPLLSSNTAANVYVQCLFISFSIIVVVLKTYAIYRSHIGNPGVDVLYSPLVEAKKLCTNLVE